MLIYRINKLVASDLSGAPEVDPTIVDAGEHEARLASADAVRLRLPNMDLVIRQRFIGDGDRQWIFDIEKVAR